MLYPTTWNVTLQDTINGNLRSVALFKSSSEPSVTFIICIQDLSSSKLEEMILSGDEATHSALVQNMIFSLTKNLPKAKIARVVLKEYNGLASIEIQYSFVNDMSKEIMVYSNDYIIGNKMYKLMGMCESSNFIENISVFEAVFSSFQLISCENQNEPNF